MRSVRAVTLLAVLTALVWPEIPRYLAERDLGRAAAAFRLLLQGTAAPGAPAAVLRRVIETGEAASAALPHDWRPLHLIGWAQLAARQPDQALRTYRRALALGERPEIVVNVGRAWALLGDAARAHQAFVRAGWASPRTLEQLPAALREPARLDIERLEAGLRAGTPAALPLPP